jgi:hypothetical protein
MRWQGVVSYKQYRAISGVDYCPMTTIASTQKLGSLTLLIDSAIASVPPTLLLHVTQAHSKPQFTGHMAHPP